MKVLITGGGGFIGRINSKSTKILNGEISLIADLTILFIKQLRSNHRI